MKKQTQRLPRDLFNSKLSIPDLAHILYQDLHNKGVDPHSKEWLYVDELQRRGRCSLVREIERQLYGQD